MKSSKVHFDSLFGSAFREVLKEDWESSYKLFLVTATIFEERKLNNYSGNKFWLEYEEMFKASEDLLESVERSCEALDLETVMQCLQKQEFPWIRWFEDVEMFKEYIENIYSEIFNSDLHDRYDVLDYNGLCVRFLVQSD